MGKFDFVRLPTSFTELGVWAAVRAHDFLPWLTCDLSFWNYLERLMKRLNSMPAVLAAAVGVTFGLSAWKISGQVPESPPFALTYDAVQEVNGSTERRFVYGRRSDGSEVRVTHLRSPEGELTEYRRIVDMGKRALIVLSPPRRSRTTFPYSQQAAEQARSDQQSLCRHPDPGSAESSEMLGYEVFKHVIDLPLTAADARIERFVAPELGCIALETRHFQRDAAGRHQLVSSERVLNVRIGEPDAALFAVPDDYVELSPAQYAERVAGLSESPASGPATPVIREFERTYREMRERERAAFFGR